MLIAFIAVVSVQWIWMKYSMREGEARFTSKVYDVLGKAVNLVEQTNNIRLFNDLKERYTQVEEVISTMNHAQDSVLTDEDSGNNEISLFSLAFSKGKVGEGQGGNISSMLRIFMNPGGRMGPGYILETENYRYCLRCNPVPGDYQAYLICFDKQVQEMNQTNQPDQGMQMGGM